MHAFRFLALANVTLSRCAALSVALVLLAPVEPAGSAVIVTAHPIGGDVVFAGGGQLDTSALTAGGGTQLLFPSITPVASAVFVGGPPVGIRPYDGGGVPVTIPPPFGTGGATLADTGEGDPFGVLGTLIYLPVDYTSGDPLSGSATYVGETFSTLGITPGIYSWSWGSGGTADTFTLRVIVPEPKTALLMAIGLGLMAVRRSNRPSFGLRARTRLGG